MLEALTLNQVAPFESPTAVEFGRRLNLLTGDNGAGKTFLLDLAWTALTRSWKDWQVWFDPTGDEEPSLVVRGHRAELDTSYRQDVRYSFPAQRWLLGNSSGSEVPVDSTWSGPVLYLRSDGGCSVWDPARDATSRRAALDFTPAQLLDGIRQEGAVLCDGLIRDLVTWQRSMARPFSQLEPVLEMLSEPGEPLRLGLPARISTEDVREFPTLRTGYGSIPFVKCSAGVQRIVGLAYLLVWMWDEHLRSCEIRRLQPTRRMVILIDEIECHLHPRWQRLILPALLQAAANLTQGKVDLQLMVATHAPLVLASTEGIFDEETDVLFHFESEQHRVAVNRVDWYARGEADSWLTSEAFGLETTRSQPAEEAVLRAMEAVKAPPSPESVRELHHELTRFLGDTDPFWPRWRYFAEKHGLEA